MSGTLCLPRDGGDVMRETIEFRIPENHASRFLAADEGVRMGSGFTRRLEVALDDPLFLRIGEIDRRLRAEGRAFFTSWIPHRRYSASELARAELMHLDIGAVFEPAGEECGTVYDESTACAVCGAGRRQVSTLRLDVGTIPAGKDIARSIANEVVVSDRLAGLIAANQLSGAELRPVLDCQGDGAVSERWHQLVVTSRPVSTQPPTRFGTDPFDDSPERSGCPPDHVVGLNVLSELWVARADWDGSDLVRTLQAVGTRRGLLVPAPLLLVSQRAFRVFQQERVKGAKVEVAHLQ